MLEPLNAPTHKKNMEDYQKMSHTTWQCKYHVIFIPKNRRGKLYGVVKKELGAVFHRLAGHKGCQIEEGHVPDHAHMLIKIPPKNAVSVLAQRSAASATAARHPKKRVFSRICGQH